MRPALSLNHNLEFDCSLVFFSIQSTSCSFKLICMSSQCFSKSYRFICLHESSPSSVRGVGHKNLYPTPLTELGATRHGCTHEKDSIQACRDESIKTHKQFKVTKCGLVINPNHPELGATPDGNIFVPGVSKYSVTKPMYIAG